VLKFPMKKENGELTPPIAHYTIAEVAKETGIHPQTVRNRIKDEEIKSVMFKQKHYIAQEYLDVLRAESPLAAHRVGVVGVIMVEDDMTPDELEDLL